MRERKREGPDGRSEVQKGHRNADMQTANSNDGEAGREGVKEGKRKRGSVYSRGKIVKDKKEEEEGGGSEGKKKKKKR